MHRSLSRLGGSLLLAFCAFAVHDVAAARIIEATSLSTCMEDSKFSASLFNVTFSPDNPDNDGGYVQFDINGRSTISGNVTFTLEVIAYGYTVISKTIDPCTVHGFEGMCPMSQGPVDLGSHSDVGKDVSNNIPGTLFPDIFRCRMAHICPCSYRVPSSRYRRESKDYGQ